MLTLPMQVVIGKDDKKVSLDFRKKSCCGGEESSTNAIWRKMKVFVEDTRENNYACHPDLTIIFQFGDEYQVKFRENDDSAQCAINLVQSENCHHLVGENTWFNSLEEAVKSAYKSLSGRSLRQTQVKNILHTLTDVNILKWIERCKQQHQERPLLIDATEARYNFIKIETCRGDPLKKRVHEEIDPEIDSNKKRNLEPNTILVKEESKIFEDSFHLHEDDAEILNKKSVNSNNTQDQIQSPSRAVGERGDIIVNELMNDPFYLACTEDMLCWYE